MHVCLYWNKGAGGGISLQDLTKLITDAGHTVDRTVEDVSELPTDLSDVDCVVAAGGDGTVGRAGRALAGGEMPLAILPLGTANNIALSLDIRGEIADIVARWHLTDVVRIDVGLITNGANRSMFLESVGCGLVTDCIDEGRRTLSKDDPDTHLDHAREMYVEMLSGLKPRRYRIKLDDEDVEGDFLLVEALNTPSIGPRIELAADVNVADELLSVVAITEGERDQIAGYLAALHSGAAAHAGFRSWRVRCVEIAGAERMHVDDKVVDVAAQPLSMKIKPASLPILA